MRIRQVKPEFWRDERLADLAPEVRLTYIGLWMIADDAGWLRLSIPEIGVDLYPYLDRVDREALVDRSITVLADRGRIVRMECYHALLPNLAKHQRLASPEKRVTTIEREHRGCPRSPADTRGDSRGSDDRPRMPDTERNGTERNGKERNGSRLSELISLTNGRWEVTGAAGKADERA